MGGKEDRNRAKLQTHYVQGEWQVGYFATRVIACVKQRQICGCKHNWIEIFTCLLMCQFQKRCVCVCVWSWLETGVVWSSRAPLGLRVDDCEHQRTQFPTIQTNPKASICIKMCIFYFIFQVLKSGHKLQVKAGGEQEKLSCSHFTVPLKRLVASSRTGSRLAAVVRSWKEGICDHLQIIRKAEYKLTASLQYSLGNYQDPQVLHCVHLLAAAVQDTQRHTHTHTHYKQHILLSIDTQWKLIKKERKKKTLMCTQRMPVHLDANIRFLPYASHNMESVSKEEHVAQTRTGSY